jgi:CspA family cold shock protein
MDDGQEVFVHYTAIDGNGFRSLEQGEQVEFEVANGPKGLQAAKVMRA